MKSLLSAVAVGVLWNGAASAQTSTLVATPAEYERALRDVAPGDTIVLKDGVWRDFQILFEAEGRPGQPVTLTAQTPGGVVLSGRSSLRLAGRQLVVSNLVFRDGGALKGEVVSFRKSQTRRAVESRITGLVIDRYNMSEGTAPDHWVALYGHDNRFDHSHLVGKTTFGDTVIVVQDEPQALRHRIDHNYFGPRPQLGSKGGVTLRVGHGAVMNPASNIVVEFNWFESADGDVEFISNRSGGNVYRSNVFFQTRGALSLRDGDGNLVEGNIFIGGGKPHTGGVRVGNRHQTVRNNHMTGLAGEGLTAALSLAYGAPQPMNDRNRQIVGAVIEDNTLLSVQSIVLGAGQGADHSARPIESRFTRNLIVSLDGHEPVQMLGDLPGLDVADNVHGALRFNGLDQGGETATIALVRGANGLMGPRESVGAGASPDLIMTEREETGVDWYPKSGRGRSWGQGS